MDEIMKPNIEKMEILLKRWSLKIDDLAAKTQMTGVQASFESIMYIDELKVLHAIAQAKFIELNAAKGEDRVRLTPELNRVWNNLDAAIKTPVP